MIGGRFALKKFLLHTPRKFACDKHLKLHFLGGAREVGRSCVFLQASRLNLLLDCGVKFNSETKFPLAPPENPHAIVATHAHLDHTGFLPRIVSDRHLPWLCTPPTRALVELLLEDSLRVFQARHVKPYYSEAEARRTASRATCIGFEEEYEFFEGTRIKFYDAGHILGSAQALISPKGEGGKTVLYTGDIKLSETQLHKGAQAPKETVGALVMESTYSGKEHENRLDLEKRFCEDVQQALDKKQPVLIPCFAIDRPQEVAEVMQKNGINGEVYIDGLGQKVYDAMLEYPEFLKDLQGIKKSLKQSHFATEKTRKKLGTSPCVIISTAGMLDGGPALSYLRRMNTLGRGKVFLTGFQVKGSNGRMLVDEGALKFNGAKTAVKLEVRQYDFSGHAGDAELVDYAKRLSPEKVFCMHGEEAGCVSLAQRLRDDHGLDAVAPKLGESFEI